jgi:hypothetical protein
MRRVQTAILGAALVWAAVGCGDQQRAAQGPTIDSFTGRLVKDGKPVAFPAEESVQLKLVTEKAKSFGIPIGADGSFKIGWMPIGKYSAILVRKPAGEKGGPNMYNVPGGFEIVDGKTDYDVELGRDWKP